MSARMRRAFAAALCLFAVAAAPASAAQPDCTGRGVPVNKISIQEYTFAGFLGSATGDTARARLRTMLAFLRDTGYRNIELYTLNNLPATEVRALLDEYGIKASARHVGVGTPTAPADIDAILEENKILGIKYFGSGSTPNYATEAQWIAYAEYLDAVGERARKAGQTLMIHNHNWEFERQFADASAYETLLAHTDPRNVVFQVDLYWSTRGLGTWRARRASHRPTTCRRSSSAGSATAPSCSTSRTCRRRSRLPARRPSPAGSRSSAAAGSTSRRSSPRARARSSTT